MSLFSPEVAQDVLVRCGRCCCLCHKFCGHKIELHHIVAEADGGPSDFENCIALCFDCHAEVRAYDPKHPKGRQFTPSELKRHRDEWFNRVAQSAGVALSRHEYIEPDRKTFTELLEHLASDGALVQTLRDTSIGELPFRSEIFGQAGSFFSWAERADKGFLDADLEQRRHRLFAIMEPYITYLSMNTFPVDYQPELNRVPKEWHYQQTQRYVEVTNTLARYAQEFGPAYDDLIRTARKKLAL